MKTYISSCLFVLMALLATSCENDLPFDFKENPPKLVMNALINADSLSNLVFLNFTGREQLGHVQEATVEVRVNGVLKESVRPLSPQYEGDPQCRLRIKGPFAPGDVVRLDALTGDGAYHAWAEAIVPQRPKEIEKIDTFSVSIKKMNYTKNYLCYKITIQDRPREDNFYRLVIDKRTTVSYYNEDNQHVIQTLHDYSFIDREDVVLTDGHPTTEEDEDNGLFDTVKNIYGVFDDSRFRNTSYTLTVYNNPVFYDYSPYHAKIEKIEVVVRLLSILENEYYYLKALNLVDSDIYDETIDEPVKYPSNVHGGTGLVSISTEVSRTIAIKE